MTTQRLNPLKTLTAALFAAAETAEKPDAQAVALAAFEEARKAAAVFAESVTRAHDLIMPIYGREAVDNDAAVTFNGVAPKDGHYSRYATFTVTKNGFNISVFDAAEKAEAKDAFQIYVDVNGGISAVSGNSTGELSHNIIEGNPSIGIISAIGTWANRTFDADTLANIKRQSETVILVNQLRHPSKPGCWESPFMDQPV